MKLAGLPLIAFSAYIVLSTALPAPYLPIQHEGGKGTGASIFRDNLPGDGQSSTTNTAPGTAVLNVHGSSGIRQRQPENEYVIEALNESSAPGIHSDIVNAGINTQVVRDDRDFQGTFSLSAGDNDVFHGSFSDKELRQESIPGGSPLEIGESGSIHGIHSQGVVDSQHVVGDTPHISVLSVIIPHVSSVHRVDIIENVNGISPEEVALHANIPEKSYAVFGQDKVTQAISTDVTFHNGGTQGSSSIGEVSTGNHHESRFQAVDGTEAILVSSTAGLEVQAGLYEVPHHEFGHSEIQGTSSLGAGDSDLFHGSFSDREVHQGSIRGGSPMEIGESESGNIHGIHSEGVVDSKHIQGDSSQTSVLSVVIPHVTSVHGVDVIENFSGISPEEVDVHADIPEKSYADFEQDRVTDITVNSGTTHGSSSNREVSIGDHHDGIFKVVDGIEAILESSSTGLDLPTGLYETPHHEFGHIEILHTSPNVETDSRRVFPLSPERDSDGDIFSNTADQGVEQGGVFHGIISDKDAQIDVIDGPLYLGLGSANREASSFGVDQSEGFHGVSDPKFSQGVSSHLLDISVVIQPTSESQGLDQSDTISVILSDKAYQNGDNLDISEGFGQISITENIFSDRVDHIGLSHETFSPGRSNSDVSHGIPFQDVGHTAPVSGSSSDNFDLPRGIYEAPHPGIGNSVPDFHVSLPNGNFPSQVIIENAAPVEDSIVIHLPSTGQVVLNSGDPHRNSLDRETPDGVRPGSFFPGEQLGDTSHGSSFDGVLPNVQFHESADVDLPSGLYETPYEENDPHVGSIAFASTPGETTHENLSPVGHSIGILSVANDPIIGLDTGVRSSSADGQQVSVTIDRVPHIGFGNQRHIVFPNTEGFPSQKTGVHVGRGGGNRRASNSRRGQGTYNVHKTTGISTLY